MVANIIAMEDTSPVGFAIADIRHQQGLKLAAVSRYVPVSTLNAIERGRIIPSITMLDAVTSGLGLPVGHLDLLYLESVRDVTQRQAIFNRLHEHDVPWTDIQAHLRHTLHAPRIPVSQHPHILYLLARISAARGYPKRSAVILAHLRRHPSIGGAARVNVLSLLGKVLLQLERPEDALGPLLEAVAVRPSGHLWETASYNLGLAWWLLGRYDQARTQWEQTLESVTKAELRGHALMGLGNVALRANALTMAVQYFDQAHQLYAEHGISMDAQARAVNNRLVAALRSRNVQDAEAAFKLAESIVDAVQSQLLRGELLETMAEWAVYQEERALAMQLLGQAKECLGTTPVLSWFSALFLELQLAGDAPGLLAEAFHMMERMIPQLHDPNLVAAIRLRMSLLAIRRHDLRSAESLLNECIPLFPSMGTSIERS